MRRHTPSAEILTSAGVAACALSPELESARAGASFRALTAFLDLRDFGLLVML